MKIEMPKDIFGLRQRRLEEITKSGASLFVLTNKIHGDDIGGGGKWHTWEGKQCVQRIGNVRDLI
jgi:hypothetical protein